MAGQTHGRRLCDCGQRGLGFPLVLDPSLWPGSLVLHQRQVVSPVSALPVDAQSVMWGFAVGWRCLLPGVAPGPTMLCLLPLLVAFPPLSCSGLTFANSPVTKGCAGNGLTTSCWSCCLASRCMLVRPPHSSKPPPSFSYWLSACA